MNDNAKLRVVLVMPVVITNSILLKATLDAVASFRSRNNKVLIVIINALTMCAPEELRQMLMDNFGARVEVIYQQGIQRSVAASWNIGCELAEEVDAEYVGILGNDTRMDADCLDILFEYSATGKADLCSGWSSKRRRPKPGELWMDGIGFSCMVCRLAVWRKHGLFDTNFRPAYFEDNDYYARVVLGGGDCHVVASARLFHHCSLTIRNDKEIAEQVRARMHVNRNYFKRKWGVGSPRNQKEAILSDYFRNPFNDPTKSLSWFPS